MTISKVVAAANIGTGLKISGTQVVADLGAGLVFNGNQMAVAASPVLLALGNQTLTTALRVVVNVGGAATWTLPAAASAAGHIFHLVNHGTGTITLAGGPVRSANTGNLTTLPQGAANNTMTIISDGTLWRRIGR